MRSMVAIAMMTVSLAACSGAGGAKFGGQNLTATPVASEPAVVSEDATVESEPQIMEVATAVQPPDPTPTATPTPTPAAAQAAAPATPTPLPTYPLSTGLIYHPYALEPTMGNTPGQFYELRDQSNPSTSLNWGIYMPFPGFQGPITYRICDYNDDGKVDVVFAPGRGGGPFMKVFPSKMTEEERRGCTCTYATNCYREKLVAQCDASFCYKDGIVNLECRGNRIIRVTFANGVVQDHSLESNP